MARKKTVNGKPIRTVQKYKGHEKEIQEELAQLGLQKMPEREQAEFYRFIDKLPLTPIGKVDYRALEHQAKQ